MHTVVLQKILKGHIIQVYEREADIGGTWRVSVPKRLLRIIRLIQWSIRIKLTLHVS